MARRPVDRRKVLTALAAAPPAAAASAAAAQGRPGWDMEVDFVSLGGGVGGLSAAIAAHESGLQPLVVEKSAKVGGVAALSLGQFWVAGNHVAAREGADGVVDLLLGQAAQAHDLGLQPGQLVAIELEGMLAHTRNPMRGERHRGSAG